MDESLSHFQETKQSHKGPRTKQKLARAKVKKVFKRVKGQNDIRKALKKDNNDLICYTKEFDKVCKKSGLDIDSEELQLVIALSKSLNTDNSDASTSQISTTQGRSAKIKTTLAEFGFQVPKITKAKTNKLEKRRKIYKLITTTEEERNHKITKKYSQVLLKCLDCSRSSTNCTYQESDSPAFHIATNLPYEFMKDNSIFYVNGLIKISTTSGSMLRNWAEIPGRPVSPTHIAKIPINFSETVCSQDELDVFLSGSLKATNNIAMKLKENVKEHTDSDIPIILIDNGELINKCHNDNSNTISEEIHENKKSTAKSCNKDVSNKKTLEIIDLVSCSTLTTMEQNRCGSPDIFEDEDISYKMDTSKLISLSQGQRTKIFTEEYNHMDLTECANNVGPAIENIQFISQNITKQNSDDFMEMTECAMSELEPIQIEHEIDLTENPMTEQNQDYKQEQNKKPFFDKGLQIFDKPHIIDLTQGCNEEKTKIMITLPEKELSDAKIVNMDLTQSSKSSDCLEDLPEVKLNNSENYQSHLEDTIIFNEEEYTGKKTIHYDQVFDLTQSFDDVTEKCAQGSKDEDVPSFFDDFIYDHSDSKQSVHSDPLYPDTVPNTSKENTKIDLTQSSDDSISNNISITPNRAENINNNISNRVDNISIDYDAICESLSNSECAMQKNVDIERLSINSNHNKSCVAKDIELGTHANSTNDLSTNSSQNSEIFYLTDKELDYSLHKSRYIPIDDCNVEFGGISLMDNISDIAKLKSSLDHKNLDLNKDNFKETTFLPENHIELAEVIDSIPPGVKLKDVTPCKIPEIGQSSSGVISIVTPTNSEYIIKTNEITPMLDYTSMTTPQRNKELDKYGLRPFKRKRAIQILTHLYNQTHPVIEPYSDDQPSHKKPRQHNTPYCSPKKILESHTKLEGNNEILLSLKNAGEIDKKSPQKEDIFGKSKSPRKVLIRKENCPGKKQSSNENIMCIYEVSSDIPIIKNVDCNPDEWVFPKKEKAKVHSCRIPLHIAFHNYVSSRISLRESILKYEPVNIDVIYKDLVSYGHRYDPRDLLRFLDKKCITVKTADNNARKNKG